ncbi:MAG: CHASE4 domain-containing protein [Candidatus Falkowbacteria bacterium]
MNKNFVYLENETVSRRLGRINKVSEKVFDSLKTKVLDWGEWDDAYDFLVDRNEEFAAGNINSTSVINLDINAVAFVDNSGQVISSYAYDFLTEEEDTSFVNLFKGKLNDPYFKNYFMTTDFQSGIVLFPGDRPPLYLVSKQVLRGDKTGPSSGYIFMGRFLDKDFVDYRFGDIALYSTMIERVDNFNIPPDFFEARNKLIMNEKFVISPGGPNNIYGYSLFEDYGDSPAFVFRVETDRILYQYEMNILLYISILLFAVMLIFVLTFLWMINKIFVSRLIKVFNKVEEYKKNPEADDINISITGKDELSKLSEEFNNLIKEISGSRNFYKNLLIRLPDIVVLAKAGRAIYVNDVFESSTGFSKEDILGKSVFDFVEKKYQDMAAENMKLRFSGVDVSPYVVQISTKGEPLDVRVNAKVIDYHGEKVDLIVLTDISDSVKAQRKIEEKINELERLNRIMINRELKMMDLKKKLESSENKE